MERIPQPIRVKLRFPHLYKEDILRVESILKKEDNDGFFVVVDKEYKYKSVEEASRHKKSARFLGISIGTPFIFLVLSPSEAYIHANSDSTKERGVVNEIQEVVKQGEQNILWFVCVYLPIVFGIILGWIIGTSFSQANYKLAGLSLVAFIGYNVFTIYFGNKKFSTVRFLDKENFFEKNKDELMRDIIKIILGAVIGFVFGKL